MGNSEQATYTVLEVFHTIQGEGFHSGKSVVFVRFGGCNLDCPWCDTDWRGGTQIPFKELIHEILSYNQKSVVLTGGEPTLQEVAPLVKHLKQEGCWVGIETNGTIEIPDGLFDWITVSPKTEIFPSIPLRQHKGNELKVVFTGQSLSDYSELKNGFTHLFLQPCWDDSLDIIQNGKAAQPTVEMVKQNPEWSLSLQTHKWLQVQ